MYFFERLYVSEYNIPMSVSYFKVKCLLTLFPAEAVIIKYWKSKTQDYHQKLNGKLASGTARWFKTKDLRKWGNFNAVYFNFRWLNESVTQKSYGFSESWTCNSLI